MMNGEGRMISKEEKNEKDRLEFLSKSGDRIKRLLARSRSMKNGLLFRKIKENLESVIEGSKVHFYGTKFMELGHERSHLNIFIEIGDSYEMLQHDDKVQQLKVELVTYLENSIKNQDESADSLWMGVVETIVTPIPTVRVFTKKKIQCDITFSSGLGVENSKLMHFLFSKQPEAFKLYHFARIWIHIDEFAFKRYVVALLVLFYLQSRNLMPSAKKLQEGVGEKMIANWNVAFDKAASLEDLGFERMHNYKDHLVDFFRFYGSFDFVNNVVCPFLGKAIPIRSYTDGHWTDAEAMVEFEVYRDNIRTFRKEKVNVADLLNLNYNVAYAVGAKRLNRFQKFCVHSENVLMEKL